MIRVVAVDLDGTLLRSDGTVSARTSAALRRATAAGARVVICTARPPREVHELAVAAGITGVAVCSNGAVTYDLATGEISIVGPLPLEVAERVAAVLAPALDGVGFAVETGHRALIGPGFDHVSSRNIVRVTVASLAALWAEAESCVKLLVWSPAPVTDELMARLQALVPDVTVTYSGGRGMLEISAAAVSKADTLARLCASWGVAAEQVIAFGDMPNDVPVLRWAGTGVAVANAHPQALAGADRVTAGNDDDGVAVVLEELFGAEGGVVPAR
ncbi:HAD family hydrolase [Catellatospora paridis]|uniref:HAD family hydrolase n=1 Tax=Catellatospora paridis TaxID=1617086 RepID=UPI0018AFA4D4|nr:HAD family hydrolase [Catellatospora paridis]